MVNKITINCHIKILIPFFGAFPFYFKYFIHTCKFNPSIKFHIITDHKKPINLPKNIQWLNISLLELNNCCSKILFFKTDIKDGYKFCDFKPAYGFIFSEYIKGYDYWGQCDIDLILGDITGYFQALQFWKYDFISVRHDFNSGFFSLFRNTEKMNTLFMNSKDYIKVFTDSKHYCFDECNNVHQRLTNGESILDIETEIESYFHVLKKEEKEGNIKAFYDFICIEGTTGRIKYDKGKLIYKNKYEAILYHMIAFKKTCKMTRPTKSIPDSFNISPTRIYVNKAR